GGSSDQILGVRPHDLKPASRGNGGLTLSGELVLIEPAGPFQFLDVDVAGHIVRATCSDASGLSSGERITLCASPDVVRYFAAEDGTRINQHFLETESRIHAL
ncbi:TOBE domain-containing protein, partial [Mesorhizobium sp. M7A.F.Ca.US.011.01.1.1]